MKVEARAIIVPTLDYSIISWVQTTIQLLQSILYVAQISLIYQSSYYNSLSTVGKSYQQYGRKICSTLLLLPLFGIIPAAVSYLYLVADLVVKRSRNIPLQKKILEMSFYKESHTTIAGCPAGLWMTRNCRPDDKRGIQQNMPRIKLNPTVLLQQQSKSIDDF